MPYRLEWEPRGIYKHYSGFVTADEFLQSITEYQGNPNFDVMRYSINDFSEVAGTDAADHDISLFAAMGAGGHYANPHIRVAVVAQSPAILEMVEIYLSTGIIEFPLRIFRSLDEARRWAEAPIEH
jgi:hypothetical protein